MRRVTSRMVRVFYAVRYPLESFDMWRRYRRIMKEKRRC